MKKIHLKSMVVTLMSGALLGVFAGCASKSYDKGAATSAALESSARQTADLSAKITDVLGALNTLTFQSQGDLRAPYNKFADTVKNLQTVASGLDARVAAMQMQAEAYFNNWSNKLSVIQNEQIRSISLQQKDDVTAKLASVNDDYHDMKGSLKPFVSHLQDIQTYLGTDLTAGGLNAIQNVVAKTKADAVPLRDSLQKLQSHLSALGAALSPVISGGGQ